MRPRPATDFLAGYPDALVAQVRQLIDRDELAERLLRMYPQAHEVRTDRALYDYVQDLKSAHMRSAVPLGKVAFDGKLHVAHNALGTHTTVSQVQGGRLKSKREIRIAAVFREMPEAFLRMIAVHELAHLREREHSKAFYQLCLHMEPDYRQLEFDLRVYLTHLETTGRVLWPACLPQQGRQAEG